MNKHIFKIFTRLTAGLLISALLLVSCSKNEGNAGSIVLNSFGPSPALRGADIKFIGENLDKVTSIILPNNVEIATSAFKSVSATVIILTVPEAAVEGLVTLKTPEGDFSTKTPLGISEPIALISSSPASVRPGDVISLTGEYLNLIKSVTFSTKKVVTDFKSQTRTTITLVVPADAQTGIIVLSNGKTDPILIESATPIQIILPVITDLSPATIKAGSKLTIKGTDLDLAKSIIFGGSLKVAKPFISQSATQIEVNVPANAQDGKIKIEVLSLLQVESATSITLLLPTITALAPNPAKTGSTITVTGTDLDVINKVTFGGNTIGSISAATSTQITVSVPATATSGTVVFGTAAGKSVTSSQTLNMLKPTLSAIAPMSSQTNKTIILSGTNLDLVKNVIFSGTATPVIASTLDPTQLSVLVPIGTTSGKVTLVANNGD